MDKEYKELIDELIELSVKEDVGDGDHTSLSTIPIEARGTMKLLVKEDSIIAGIDIAKRVFKRLEPNVNFTPYFNDGDSVKVGDIVFIVEGRIVALLQAERIVLNIMQRMSGVATKTKLYVDSLKGYNCQVLDTRKTTPGMRVLEKLAVKIGGGANHRMGLYDMIMIKDNHIDFAGGITAAINKSSEYCVNRGRGDLKIEVEVRSLDDVREVLATGMVNRIMLDNFSIELTKEAVQIVRESGKDIEIESSGGIRFESLRDYAACGVDFISVGALTHQVQSIDLSLKVSE